MTIDQLTLNAPPRDETAQRIRTHLSQAVIGFVAAGRELAVVKDALPHGEFEPWVRGQVGISMDMAQRLMAIATHPTIAKADHGRLLPPSWTTLYQLSRLPAPLLERAIKTGEVTPELQRDDARELVSRYAAWTEQEQELLARLQAGETVAVTQRGDHDNLIGWAESAGLYVRIDRRTEWGNPFLHPDDGDRATVIASYRDHYWPHKPSLHERIGELRGKALGCWCAPEACHGDILKELAER